MNKIEIVKGLYRQNIYNINFGNGKYNHLTCYFDKDFNIISVFKAGTNSNMTDFIASEDLTPLKITSQQAEIIKEVLSSWTYSHIKPIDLYNKESMFNTSCKGIFEVTKRDKKVIRKVKKVKILHNTKILNCGGGFVSFSEVRVNKSLVLRRHYTNFKIDSLQYWTDILNGVIPAQAEVMNPYDKESK